MLVRFVFFFQAEDGIRDYKVTGVQTCALPISNHLTGEAPESVVTPAEVPQVTGRSMLVKRLKPVLIEAVVRGYLAGSGWKEYQESRSVCGVPLPEGLTNAAKLPEPDRKSVV